MARCSITGKRSLRANSVSKAYNHTIRWQRANIQKKRIFDEELNRFVKIKISTQALRTVEKIGLSSYLRKKNIKLSDIEIL